MNLVAYVAAVSYELIALGARELVPEEEDVVGGLWETGVSVADAAQEIIIERGGK